jgi:hypothetical protein
MGTHSLQIPKVVHVFSIMFAVRFNLVVPPSFDHRAIYMYLVCEV